MPDIHSATTRRAVARPEDDRVPRRPPLGLVAHWAMLRNRTIRRVLRGGPVPAPGVAPGPAHLAAVIAAMQQDADLPRPCIVGAALDMLDGTVAGLNGPADRRLALVLAAAAQGLAGNRVHVVCLSQDTAQAAGDRAAAMLGRLGLAHACLPDTAGIDQREAAYAARILFAPAARLAQDALRDRELLGRGASGQLVRIRGLAGTAGTRALVRGNPVALVDDADITMLEAQRAVSFAADPEEAAGRLRAEEAFVLLRGMERGVHYEVDAVTRRIRLTDAGEDRMDLAAALFEGPWTRRAWREETILAALTVRDFFVTGEDYRIEEGRVELARPPAAAAEPGIDVLVAVKEGLAPSSPSRRQWHVRRHLSAYPSLAGIGVALADVSEDFRRTYGLDVRDASRPPAAPDPEFLPAPDRKRRCAAAPAGTVLWAPTPADAQHAGIPADHVVMGEAVFALPDPPDRIIQIAAAPLRWEQRLADCFPDSRVTAFADAADPVFAALGEDSAVVARLARSPDVRSYRLAQAALASALSLRRAAHLRSDRYFDRILAFAGDAP